jgi:hypothetical protein
MALLSHRKTATGHTGPVSDKPVIDGPVEMQNQQPAYPQQTYQAPPMDSPYQSQQAYAGEHQQTYPVEHQQQQPQQGYYHAGEQQPQATYPVEHQQAPYPVEHQQQQAYAVPDHEQNQAYAVPDTRQPHQQV